MERRARNELLGKVTLIAAEAWQGTTA